MGSECAERQPPYITDSIGDSYKEGCRAMKRTSLSGYVLVRLVGFLKPLVECLPETHKLAVKDMVFLIAGLVSIMISRMVRRMSWGPWRMIHREKGLCRQAIGICSASTPRLHVRDWSIWPPSTSTNLSCMISAVLPWGYVTSSPPNNCGPT